MYAKVFTQIFDSSIADDWQVRHVFEDLLKLADINGVVDMTREAIARRTNVPIEIITRAITELEKPDPRSRTQEHEGRRIVRLNPEGGRDWGWIVVNYEHYRRMASEEQRREKTRARVANFRSKQEDLLPCNAPVTHVTPSNACNAMKREREKNKERSTPLPPEGEPRERMLRVGALFGRRPTTTWSLKEIVTFRKTAELSPEDEFILVEDYYKSGHEYLRHDLQTLLNNWPGEVDRAVLWDRKGRQVGAPRQNGAAKQGLLPGQVVKILEEEIASHPANQQYVGYNHATCTEAMRDALRQKRAKLAELKAKLSSDIP